MSTFCKPSQGFKFVMKLYLVKFQVYQTTITLVLGDLLQNVQLEDREVEVRWGKKLMSIRIKSISTQIFIILNLNSYMFRLY